MGVFLRANGTALLEPGVRKVVNTTLDLAKRSMYYSSIFNMQSSTQRNEVDRTFSGLGAMVEKAEGEDVTFDSPIQGYEKTYTHTTYALGTRVTMEMLDDDLYRHILKVAKSLPESAVQAVETVCADVFNNGFTVTTGNADGKELFATDHPLLEGGTEQNELTTAADLSQTSLQTAIQDIIDTTNDRGMPNGLIAKRLIVPTANQWTARQLLNSAQTPENANNSVNPLRDENLQLTTWPYLTDTDSFFIICQSHELNFFWRMQPKLESETDFDSGDSKFKLTERFSVGHSDWRGAYGSPGA